MSSERTYYADASGIRVSTTRLVFPSATYVTRNVSAVDTIEDSPTALGAYVVIALGSVMFFYGAIVGSLWGFIGVFGIISGQFRLVRRNKRRGYAVRITTPKGTIVAFASRNRTQVQQVGAAVRKAMAAPTLDVEPERPPRSAPEEGGAAERRPARADRTERVSRPHPQPRPRGRRRRR